MGNKPKPPTASDRQILDAMSKIDGHEADVSFRFMLDRANHLLDEGKISAFSYYAEILTFIARVSFKDPVWLDYFSVFGSKDPAYRTVTIPVAFLGPLSEGWTKYREAEDNLSLGRAMGVESGGQSTGQGKRPDRDSFSKMEKDYHLALQVISWRSFHAQRGRSLSVEQAIDELVEFYTPWNDGKGISRKSIKEAYRAHRDRILSHLKDNGLKLAPKDFEKSAD